MNAFRFHCGWIGLEPTRRPAVAGLLVRDHLRSHIRALSLFLKVVNNPQSKCSVLPSDKTVLRYISYIIDSQNQSRYHTDLTALVSLLLYNVGRYMIDDKDIVFIFLYFSAGCLWLT